MILTPLKSVFPCLPPVLGYLNHLVVVVLTILQGAVITVQGVHTSRPPTVASPFSNAGETVFTPTLVTTPWGWLSVKVVNTSTANLSHEETDLSALIVFVFFGPDQFGKLAATGVGYKQGYMMVTISKPVLSFQMFLFLSQICFPRSQPPPSSSVLTIF